MKKILLLPVLLAISCFAFGQNTAFVNKIYTSNGGYTTPALVAAEAFGACVANIGDIDGDGDDELLVGSTLSDQGGTNRGAIYILFLNSDGTIDGTKTIRINHGTAPTDGGAALALQDNDIFGVSACRLGDLDGDNKIEIAVGAQHDRNSGGAVHILELNADGTLNDIVNTINGGTYGSGIFEYFGFSVENIGDLNNDGTDDLAVGVREDNNATGSIRILFMTTGWAVLGAPAATTITASDGVQGDRFGSAIEALGDIDNDGVEDIAVGAFYRGDGGEARTGAIYIYYLKTNGTVKREKKISNSYAGNASFVAALNTDDRMGRSIAYGADFNNDGVKDMAVGMDKYDVGASADEGAVFLLYLDKNQDIIDFDIISSTDCNLSSHIGAVDIFGSDIDLIDDLNGDGIPELFVGAQYDNESGTGAAYIIGPDRSLKCVKANSFTMVRDITISSNQTWQGQYQIGGTVTIDNDAIIDITNADIVFEECATIEFTDGSSMIANNSVFRTCNDLCGDGSIWKGISFENSVGNIINECTFLDADIALDFGDGAYGKVTNSSFKNFYRAIYIHASEATDFDAAINNNSFIIDNDRITSSSCLSSAIYARGIEVSNRDILQNISQNSFINNTDGVGFGYTGVYAGNSSLNVTDNNFSNLRTSILLTNISAKTNIENNKIEVTKGFVEDDVQISVVYSSSFPAYIFGNTLHNTQRTVDLNADADKSGAIYTLESQSVNIKNNSVIGFKVAIQLEVSSNCQVVENHILNSNIYGVYTSNSTSLLISCNEIDMDFGGNNTNVVRGIYCKEIGNASTIHSNCIKDCHHSIYLHTATSTANNIPTIRNNFLYNYVIAGVYAYNYNGTIGNNTKAGMNAFYSNYSTGADIYADGGTIDQNYNQAYSVPGTANGGSVISTYGTGYTFSTASCAFQHNGGSTKQTNLNLDDFTCDEFSTMTLFVVRNDDKTYFDQSKYNENVKASSNKLFNMGIALANSYNEVENTIEAKKTLDEILTSDKLNNTQKAWIKIEMGINLKNYQSALTILGSIVPQSIDEENRLFVYTKLVEQKMGYTIADNELDRLYSIAADKDGYSIIADEIIRTVNPEHGEYNFKPVLLEKANVKYNDIVFDQSRTYVTVYPNPAANEISLSYNIGTNTGGTIKVYSVTGQVVKSIDLTKVSSTKFTIDVTDLQTGVYIVSIEANDGTSEQTKFIKQ